MDKYEFELGQLEEGNVVYAKTKVNGINVEFQGHNDFPVALYNKVIVSKNDQILLIDDTILIYGYILNEDVERYVSKALKQG